MTLGDRQTIRRSNASTVSLVTRPWWSSRAVNITLMAAWSVLLLFLFTEGNHFATSWSLDEPSKVEQITSGEWNFHHPQLMLRATDTVLWLTGGHTRQQIVIAGRWVSAVAAVATVDVLALLAVYFGGPAAGYLTALMVGTSSLLYGLSHYMKEDAVYIFGIAAFLLALVRYEAKPSKRRLALLGLTAGIAVSGKYLGVITFPLMIGMILRVPLGDGITRLKPCAFALANAVGVFLLINFAMIREFNNARWTFEKQTIDVLTNHDGFYRPVTSTFYVDGLLQICGLLVLGAYACWFVILLRSRRQIMFSQAVIAILPLGYLALLQVTPVKLIRYELPPALMITVLAACCLARLPSSANGAAVRILVSLVGIAIVASNGLKISYARAAIVHDTRAEMARWIDSYLDPNAVLLEDRLAGMIEAHSDCDPDIPSVPIRVISLFHVPQHWTLDEERAAGVTHVLIADENFGRYFNRTFEVDTSDSRSLAEIARARAFYRDLFATGALLRHIEGATPPGTFFSPGLWLFSIEKRVDPAISAPASPPVFDLLQD